MAGERQLALSGYLSGLLAAGRTVFTADEAEGALGLGHGAFLDAAGRLQRHKALVRPRQGLYVAVPPEYAPWGAPPPSWYIDALMQGQGVPYYVGLLKAAALHGASHQAVMEFRVVAASRLPRILAGLSRIVFYFRKDMAAVAAGVEERQTDTGTMKVASPALTALDLLRYPRAAGGIDNVATVLADLKEAIDPEQLASLSAGVERPVVQRLGFMLDRFAGEVLARPMLAALQARGDFRWTDLEPQRGPSTLDSPVRDRRWRVFARQMPEPDE